MCITEKHKHKVCYDNLLCLKKQRVIFFQGASYKEENQEGKGRRHGTSNEATDHILLSASYEMNKRARVLESRNETAKSFVREEKT